MEESRDSMVQNLVSCLYAIIGGDCVDTTIGKGFANNLIHVYYSSCDTSHLNSFIFLHSLIGIFVSILEMECNNKSS